MADAGARSPIHVPTDFLRTALSPRRRWSIIGLLSIASVINYLDRFTLSVSLPLISHELHLGPEDKGILLSAFFWSYALMQVPIGWAVDHMSLRWLYAVAFAVWSFAQGMAGAARTFIVLLATRVLLGVGESIYLPGGTKIVTLLFPPEKSGLPSGLFDFGTRCGMALGGVVIPLLLIHYGWRMTFIVIGFVAMLWLVPWLLVFPSHVRGFRHQTRKEVEPAAHKALGQEASAPHPTEDGSAPDSRNPIPETHLAPTVRVPLLNRDLAGICLGFFCFDYYWYLLVTWLPDYLVTVRKLTILKAGLYSAAPFLVYGLSEPLGGWLADRLIHRGWNETLTRKGMITGAFLTGLLLIPAAHVTQVSVAVVLILGGSLVGLASGNLIVLPQACAPPHQVGLWTGIENLFGNIAGVLAPLVTGILIAATGSYSPGFELAAFVLVAGIASYWLIVGKLERRWKP